MNYHYGSMWRKWDLHIHTPYSFLNNDFGDPSKEDTWNNYVYLLFKKAIDMQIYAIGITDYFLVDGYKKVLQIKNNKSLMETIFSKEIEQDPSYLGKIERILLLPNIEFRLDQTVSIDSITKKESKLQIHVIFSNELCIEDIENKFLSLLTINDSDGLDSTKYPCKKTEIEKFGNSCIKKGLGGMPSSSPLSEGMIKASISFQDALKILKGNAIFKNKYLILAVEEDISKINWSNQAGSIRANIYSQSNGLFSSNEKTIEWAKSDDAIQICKEKKPCYWGSDAHSFDKMFSPALDKYCWIKADTSFLGLMESTYSFENRVFIGDAPLELTIARQRKNYTLQQIECHPISKDNKAWFDFKIDVNPFMVTIIGNKGSGKSALTDIVGLCGNSEHMGYASFLKKDRFKKGTNCFASQYRASILFTGSEVAFKVETLNAEVNDGVERVQYLPQSYIENICNDIDAGFQNEINKVLYSFVSSVDREGTNNLDELVTQKTSITNEKLVSKRADLSKTNMSIRGLEHKNEPTYKKSVENSLAEQKIRKDNWLKNKPNEVKKPLDLESDQYSKQIVLLDTRIKDLEDELNKKTNELLKSNSQIEELKIIIEKINSVGTAITFVGSLVNEYKQKHLLSFAFDFKTKTDFSGLNAHIEETNKQNQTLREQTTLSILGDYKFSDVFRDEDIDLVVAKEQSIKNKIVILNAFRNRLSNKANEENTKYLHYLDEFKKWKRTLDMIEGLIPDEEGKGSIKKSQDELDYLANALSNDLKEKKAERDSLIKDIYALLKEKECTLQSIYDPIQSKLDTILQKNEEKIAFNVQIKSSEVFIDTLLSHINQSVLSVYRGTEEGRRHLFDEVNSTDFDAIDSTTSFISEIMENVTSDESKIDALLKNDYLWFYNYLCGMEFLDSKFSLTMGNKQLKELSPGERGIVLLVFYLALSSKSVPLIIDQPEDNLDNQSIFTKLVPCIIEAKKNRQIIVVTHNPNIAIACDSEQIIYCSMDKVTNKIAYESGSIENLPIKKHVIDILEGTQVAFDCRKLKYEGH